VICKFLLPHSSIDAAELGSRVGASNLPSRFDPPILCVVEVERAAFGTDAKLRADATAFGCAREELLLARHAQVFQDWLAYRNASIQRNDCRFEQRASRAEQHDDWPSKGEKTFLQWIELADAQNRQIESDSAALPTDGSGHERSGDRLHQPTTRC